MLKIDLSLFTNCVHTYTSCFNLIRRTLGALSEQSYIPMNSSSVVGSMRTNSRISVMPVIHGPKSLWIGKK